MDPLGLVVLVVIRFIGSCVEHWYFHSWCMVSLLFRCKSVVFVESGSVFCSEEISFEESEICERYKLGTVSSRGMGWT